MTASDTHSSAQTQDLIPSDLREKLVAARLEPLWESRLSHNTDPGPPDDGHLWHWQDLRETMLAVGEITSPKIVERRVLQMMDPRARYGDGDATVGAVNATLQMLKPGEQARPHRHSMNALRFVLESTGGARTMVDGKDCPMETGDLVLTPAWCWHTHIHEGAAPVIWLDVLDVALHRFLGTEIFQPGPMTNQPHQLPESAFHVPNMVPLMEYEDRDYSPVFRYPWAEAVRSVEAAPVAADGARRVRYANPLTGGESMPLLDCTLTQIEAGATTKRQTVGADAVFCVAEGAGKIEIGETAVTFSEKDIFTVPLGRPFRFQADAGRKLRLFGVSNAPAYRRLGLFQHSLEA